MRKCPYCRIEVGGDLNKCPLCQSKLMGESEAAYFPRQTTLQLQSFFCKLQLFIMWVIVIVAISLDFMFGLRIGPFLDVHWSLLLSMWVIVFEFEIFRQFKTGTGSSRKMTMMVFVILIMLMITSYYFEFWKLTLDWLVPMAILTTMVANYILAMIDKIGIAMAYLLTNLLVGVIPYIVLYVRHQEMPVAWIICMIASVILFVGAVIFKGRSVASEIRKRFNM